MEQEKLERVQQEVNQVIQGKSDVVRKVFAAMLAGGHILMEDIPGVGKTTLATTFAKTLDLRYHRVQFTPDVLPSDILGFSMHQNSFIRVRFSVICFWQMRSTVPLRKRSQPCLKLWRRDRRAWRERHGHCRIRFS